MIEPDELRRVLTYCAETGVFRWRVCTSNRVCVGARAGQIDRHGHRYINVLGKRYGAHRLAWLYVHGRWPTGEIDHINRMNDDNRIANLREATRSENNCNRGKTRTNRSGFKGVVPFKGGFIAQIGKDGKHYHLGWFKSASKAYEVYCKSAYRLHGEFVRVK